MTQESWLSPYVESVNVKLPNDARKKLVETLDESRYVCHYRSHKIFVRQGLKVKTFHRILQFKANG